MVNDMMDFCDIDSYIKCVRQIPSLTKEEEKELIDKKNNGDENAYKRLVEANLRLVIPIAKKYANNSLPLEDLIQNLNIKLLRSIRLFQQGNLQMYISRGLMWEIRCSIRNNSKINITYEMAQDLMKISDVYKNNIEKEEDEPTNSELSSIFGIDEEEINSLLNVRNDSIVSIERLKELEVQGNEEALFYNDYVMDDLIYDSEIKKVIRLIIERLPDKQKIVIKYSFGLVDGHCYNQKEIAKLFGISSQRISQYYLKGLRRIERLLILKNSGEFAKLYLNDRSKVKYFK